MLLICGVCPQVAVQANSDYKIFHWHVRQRQCVVVGANNAAIWDQFNKTFTLVANKLWPCNYTCMQKKLTVSTNVVRSLD